MRTPALPVAADARRARFASALAVITSSLLVGVLVPRVLATLVAGNANATLARALPGGLGGLLSKFAEAPLLVAVFVAFAPPLLWVASRLAGALIGSDPRALDTGLAFAWTVSVLASASAIVWAPGEIKQGLAALGYALAWPAVLSVAAVLWSSALPRVLAHGLLLFCTLAGLVARVLPIGWPGEHSLSWWAMLTGVPPGALLFSLSLVAVAALLVCVVIARAGRVPSLLALLLLSLASLLLLRALPMLEHYGPAKHPAALASEINTSYFQAAGRVTAPGAFVRAHAATMPSLAMHARTHPPLWPLAFHAATRLGAADAPARAASLVARALGADTREAAELAASVAEQPLSLAQVNGLWLLVGGFALAVALLPFAVWFLASAFASPRSAVRAAALAVLLPAPLLYFPDVDVLHPVLYALAAGAWLRRERGTIWPLTAGGITALLVALSFGNLALLACFMGVAWLGAHGPGRSPGHDRRHTVLLLLPLVALAVVALLMGAHPYAMLTTALAQHRAILAHRTRLLWMALHPLECAVGVGFPLVFAFARGFDWRGLFERARARSLEGGELLWSATLATLLLLDLSGASKGESARLWMGWFPLALAGGVAALDTRERGWAWLVLGLAVTLVVLKGFYVFVWLYRLA